MRYWCRMHYAMEIAKTDRRVFPDQGWLVFIIVIE